MDTPGNTQPEANPELHNNPIQPPAETPTESIISGVIIPEISANPLSEAIPVVVEEIVMPANGPIPPVENTIPTVSPHLAHSALRRVVMTLIILIVAIGGWYSWTHQAEIAKIMKDITGKFMSPVQPLAPENFVSGEVSGEVWISEEKPFDFSTAPKFDTKQLVTTEWFATYKEPKIQVNANAPMYKIANNLTNVKNKDYFTNNYPLSKEMVTKLKINAFTVQAASYNEFYSLYEQNRYALIPSFITTDSILHNYHLMFDHLLKQLEEEKLAFILHTLNANLVSQAEIQLAETRKTPWKLAAERNLGFFTVGSKLLDNSVAIPSAVQKEVTEELNMIEAKKGITNSVVMNKWLKEKVGEENFEREALKEDYTQYVPRGHYTQSALLKSYFRSMMWYGRLSFRFKNEDEIRSAVLITLALRDSTNKALWQTLSDPIDFFVGKGDDIWFRDMNWLLEEVYGKDVTLKSMIAAPDKFAKVIEKTKKLAPPEINSMPIFDPTIAPDREEEIKWFRFLGQRFTIDAAIFQRLIFREVKANDKQEKRMLPKWLDIPAALGSQEALAILEKAGDTKYENYPENMEKLQKHLSGLPWATWTQNLYWGWINTLRTLTDDERKGYPLFMQNQAWTHKELNTFLGSWAELKHDTILYAKQVYAELGGGGDEDGPTPPDDRGYVEPNPELYGRLTALLQMTREGLDAKKLLSDGMRDNLTKMGTLTTALTTISEKELKNTKLTPEEYELIRSYGGQLEHFWMEVNKEAMAKKELDARNFLNQNPAALIADVATDPGGEVLEVGTGNIFSIYVIVPVDGMLKLTRGGVYSYYEFPWPMDDRLTDEKWRGMMGIAFDGPTPALPDDKKPTQPAWTQSFMSK